MIEVTTKNAEEVAVIQAAFLKPFDLGLVKFKPQSVKNNRALALAYIDSRLVMDRLDEVVHIDGWHDEYTLLPNGSVECRLSVKLAGTWVTKADVGSQSEQPDEGDRMKAAYSDALKRAAVKFGIGRFLYRTTNAWHDYDPVKRGFAYQLMLLADGKIVAQPRGNTMFDPKPASPPERVVATERELLAAKTRDVVNIIAGRIADDVKAKRIDERGANYLRPIVQAAFARFFVKQTT